MSFNCINCNKQSQPIVILVCDHQICLACADKIKTPEGKPPLDAKFRIVCPRCSKNTVTHNVHNLINEEQDKLLFQNIQSSQLNQSSIAHIGTSDPSRQGWSQRQLREMSYSQRFSNIWAERKTPDIADRVSKGSADSKGNPTSRGNRQQANQSALSTTKCHIHQEIIMFYCEQQSKVMCVECMYKHTKEHKNHKVLNVKDAIGLISSENKNFKLEAKKKIQQIQKSMNTCKVNRSKIQQAFSIHQQLIEKEFSDLINLVKIKQQQTLQTLQRFFQKKDKEISGSLSDLGYLKNCLKEHYEYSIQNSNSQVYFFNAYTIMKSAISKVSTNFKQIEKQQLACFDKLASLNDFKNLLDKFIRPKKDGRQSKAVSRGGSQNGDKLQSKSTLYEQVKNAKKKLFKLDKMQKQHNGGQKDKTSNYLNNYVIEIQKKQNDGQKHHGIKQRKSSAAGYYQHEQRKVISHKALTPTRISTSKTSRKK